MFSKKPTDKFTKDFSAQIERLKAAIAEADAIVIGAGAGLSTSAGFTYSGERFERYFSDLGEEIKVLDKPQTIAIGPFAFQNLDDEEQETVERKARSHESQLNSCYRNYERRVGKRATSFVLEVPLDNQLMGRPLLVVMKDPFEEHRRLPAVDSEFIQCVRHVYSDLALSPTLNPEKSVRFMISMSAQKISPWIK